MVYIYIELSAWDMEVIIYIYILKNIYNHPDRFGITILNLHDFLLAFQLWLYNLCSTSYMSYLQSWPWKDLEVLCWFQGGSVSGREASPNLPGGPRTASALSSSPRAKWLVGWALMMAKDHALWNFLRIFALVFHDLAFLWRKKELGLGLHQKKCCHVGRIKLMTWMALFHQFTDKNSKQTSHAWKCGNFLQQESVSFNGFSLFSGWVFKGWNHWELADLGRGSSDG